LEKEWYLLIASSGGGGWTNQTQDRPIHAEISQFSGVCRDEQVGECQRCAAASAARGSGGVGIWGKIREDSDIIYTNQAAN